MKLHEGDQSIAGELLRARPCFPIAETSLQACLALALPIGAYSTQQELEMSPETGVEQVGSGRTDAVLRQILQDVLGLDAARVAAFQSDTGLFGDLPELDSMAVAGLLTEIEDRLHITIDDDEVDGEMLETYGALLAFVERKREGA